MENKEIVQRTIQQIGIVYPSAVHIRSSCKDSFYNGLIYDLRTDAHINVRAECVNGDLYVTFKEVNYERI